MPAGSGDDVPVDQGISTRLWIRIRDDFPNDASRVAKMLEAVKYGNQDRERVLAAVVLGSGGQLRLLHELIELSRLDWRDALVAGGLANEDWPSILDIRLGPPG
jgi:hypothetical protein